MWIEERRFEWTVVIVSERETGRLESYIAGLVD
jgi:hypothetical protein